MATAGSGKSGQCPKSVKGEILGASRCFPLYTSGADIWRAGWDVRFGATTTLMHRSKQHLYSIASLARASNVCGTLRPSALAVVHVDPQLDARELEMSLNQPQTLIGTNVAEGSFVFFNLTISVSLPLTPTEC